MCQLLKCPMPKSSKSSTSGPSDAAIRLLANKLLEKGNDTDISWAGCAAEVACNLATLHNRV